MVIKTLPRASMILMRIGLTFSVHKPEKMLWCACPPPEEVSFGGIRSTPLPVILIQSQHWCRSELLGCYCHIIVANRPIIPQHWLLSTTLLILLPCYHNHNYHHHSPANRFCVSTTNPLDHSARFLNDIRFDFVSLVLVQFWASHLSIHANNAHRRRHYYHHHHHHHACYSCWCQMSEDVMTIT